MTKTTLLPAADQAGAPGRLWRISGGLALLGLLPGLARLLVGLAGDPEAASRPGSPPALPIVLHIVGGTGFAVLGAFQFPTARRRSTRAWHRRTGRLLVAFGLAASLSGIWLALFSSHLRDGGELLTTLRVSFGTAMAAGIILAVAAIRRHDVIRHRTWMIRSYAIGLGAGTQIFTLGIGGAILGTEENTTALLNGAGWLINLAVAERCIRGRRRDRSIPP